MEVALQKFAESTKDDGTIVADVEEKCARVRNAQRSFALQQTRVFFFAWTEEMGKTAYESVKRHAREPRTNRVTRESDASDLYIQSSKDKEVFKECLSDAAKKLFVSACLKKLSGGRTFAPPRTKLTPSTLSCPCVATRRQSPKRSW